MTFVTGDIVKHVARKSAVYLVVMNDPGATHKYNLVRVRKTKGYPIVPQGRYVENHDSRLTKVDHVATYANLTKEDCLRSKHQTASTLPEATGADYAKFEMLVQSEFVDLASDLSPENLSCDGELPRSQVEKRYRSLKSRWAKLEKQVGFTVSDAIVWAHYCR